MPTGTDLTLGLILTGAGVTVAAALIASIIEIIKRVPWMGPRLDAGLESFAAILLAALLVAYAYVATVTSVDAAGVFAAFLAWVGIAGLAGRAYDVGSTVKAAVTPSP